MVAYHFEMMKCFVTYKSQRKTFQTDGDDCESDNVRHLLEHSELKFLINLAA